ncbi:glycoside hydrolase family 97 catalytic domain-containing protein [Streptomyces sp. NBC_01089]|uniref:glycoside hydrolase family 97 catalytic domain-containing protein n=1 Tax=Streptomyces sp. NBC_01089 TaxID=2903747 RepID=UPI00386E2B99|nr:glycoside hydrolase family 97 catalytic domain-containing protein [Streptomyces sp. NBC_01089]
MRRRYLRAGPMALMAAAVTAALALGPANPASALSDNVVSAYSGPAATSWTVQRGGPTAVVTLNRADGSLDVSVRRNGRTILEPAPVGVVTDQADLTSGLHLLHRDNRAVDEKYTTTVGKQLHRSVHMNESRFAFGGKGGARIDLVVRAADDGVAYRYVLPGKDGVTIEHEASAFQPPASSAAWLSTYSAPHEQPYDRSTAASAGSGEYGYPALFQVGDQNVVLAESDLDGRYSGSRLVHEQGTARYEVALADKEVHSDGPLTTPWRTAVIGDLATVTESTLIDDLAPPSRIRDTSWIKPGKVAWSWLAGFNEAQRSLATQEKFVDYAAAHGWQYALVDDGWKTTDWMPQLMDYAHRRGVKILLWMAWTDLDTPAKRDAQLNTVKKWGAAGLKIDFMDSDTRERYQWYDDILKATAARRLIVDFHGSTIPNGIQRTWPQVMSMEAVHGAEQGDVRADNIATLPFTRNVVGSMDFTPMGFQFGQRNTSDAAELALSVIFESGLQNFAGSIEEYRARPELARFLEQVPTVWDETKLLKGSAPGRSAGFARRSGARWFLGEMAAGAARTHRVPLDFLSGGKWRVDVVRDGSDGLVRESRVLTRHDTLEVPGVENGGFAAIVCRAVPGRTSCDLPVRHVPSSTLTVNTRRTAAHPGTVVKLDGSFAIDEFGPVTDVTLSARTPAGWSVEGAGATAAELATGQPLTADWRITVPEKPAYGWTEIPVTATYRDPAAGATAPELSVRRQARVFVSPPGTDYVSDLPFSAESNGWGPVERDMSNGEEAKGDGGPLRIGDRTYDKGLGAHAPSEVTVGLGGTYDRFSTDVGIDKEVSDKGSKGSVVFDVIGDGKVLGTSGVMDSGDAAHAFDIDVTGVQQLTLRVTDGGDGNDSDHADWADARLHIAAGTARG